MLAAPAPAPEAQADAAEAALVEYGQDTTQKQALLRCMWSVHQITSTLRALGMRKAEMLTLEMERSLNFLYKDKVVGERRRLMETKIEHLVFRDVHAKLASLLLELGREYGKETEDGLQIDQKITHQEMANLIGSTRETISLALAAFKRKELVQLFGRTVVLTDLEGLAALT